MANEAKTHEKPEEMGYEDTLKYAAGMGERLTHQANVALVMLKECERKGIKIDDARIKDLLAKFAPTGELEMELLRINSQLSEISTIGYEKGVKLTQRDLRNRMQQLGLGVEKQAEAEQERGDLDGFRADSFYLVQDQFMREARGAPSNANALKWLKANRQVIEAAIEEFARVPDYYTVHWYPYLQGRSKSSFMEILKELCGEDELGSREVASSNIEDVSRAMFVATQYLKGVVPPTMERDWRK